MIKFNTLCNKSLIHRVSIRWLRLKKTFKIEHYLIDYNINVINCHITISKKCKNDTVRITNQIFKMSVKLFPTKILKNMAYMFYSEKSMYIRFFDTRYLKFYKYYMSSILS